MQIDQAAEARTRMGDRMDDAQRRRLATHAGATRTGGGWSTAGYRRRLRQAAGFGLVRTGLWLLDARRA